MDTLPPVTVPLQAPASHAVGILLVPSTRPDTSEPLTVSSHGSSIAEARIAALGEAARLGIARGNQGPPRIRAEAFQNGTYNAVIDFSDSRAPATDAAPPVTKPSPAEQPSRPSWIMIVPFEDVAGGKALWGRASAWSKAWVAPVKRQGMRLVTVMGDADDRDRLTARMLGDPSSPATIEAALSVGRKYGAPAVALLRYQDSGTVTAWLARPGGSQVTRTFNGATVSEAREAAITALAGMQSEAHSNPTADADGGTTIDLKPEGQSPPGTYGFSLVVEARDSAAIAKIRRAVIDMAGVTVKRVVTDDDGMEIVGYWPGDRASLERALTDAGAAPSTG